MTHCFNASFNRSLLRKKRLLLLLFVDYQLLLKFKLSQPFFASITLLAYKKLRLLEVLMMLQRNSILHCKIYLRMNMMCQDGKYGSRHACSAQTNTGAPQGCVLRSLLNTLYAHDYMATSDCTTIIKFPDDIVAVNLISDNTEKAYVEEVTHLENWFQENNLSKTKGADI